MLIGNWGLALVFTTSDSRVLAFRDMSRTVSAEWATHSRMQLKDQSEFIRPALQEITFEVQLSRELGVHPRLLIDIINAAVESGVAHSLVIGYRKIGKNKWVITNAQTSYDTVRTHGEIINATVQLTMKEYL